VKQIDPDRMAPAERVAELGEHLATGIQRFLARECKAAQNQRDQLDVVGRVEAPCGATTQVPA
jgi:hypothetical protein